MTVALLAILAAALLAGMVLLLALRLRARYARVLDAALDAVREHARITSTTLDEASGRAERARAAGASELELVFNLDTLLARVAREAAARAEAPAVAVRVERVGGDDALASFGPYDAEALLEHVPVPPHGQPFRALTVSWTQGRGPGQYRSAVVVPIVEHDAGSGLLVACSDDTDAFGAGEVDALETLARDLATSLANARRFAAVAAQSTVDDASGGSRALEL